MVLAALLLPTAHQPRRVAAVCVRSPLIRGQWICGKNVVWVNPDGSRVVIGKTTDLLPMPRPLPWTRSWQS